MARDNQRKPLLSRLARDVRGNTLAIMAAAMIPLAGLVGGGIDISRMYIAKTRLQHACDAGALAGRKAMGGGTWTQQSNYPNTIAQQFFDGNFASGSYGTTGLTRSFSENAGTVTGTATVTVPMTLMRVLGQTTQSITVTCTTDMRLPNTDVMFVLDTTGSMGQVPSGDTQTKIASLKVAVKCFYEIVARLDTDATCTTGTPSGGTGSSVQIRFGFVPYATNVNVGRLLNNDWIANSRDYQTRVANWTPPGTTSNGPYWEQYWGGSIPQSDCLSFMNNTAFSGFSPTPTTSGGPSPTPLVTVVFNSDGTASSGGSNGEWGWSGAPDTSGSNRSCRRLRTDTTTTYVPTFRDWTYRQASINISGLKAGGTSWNTSFTAPVGANGTNATITWEGCIEERQTVWATNYNPIPSGAKDLNIDLVPTTGDATTQWGAALPGVTFTRNDPGWWDTSSWSLTNSTTASDYVNASYYACPQPARKMQAWPNADDFDAYVDALTPEGNTYHDIGLLWGARLMSPNGIFASENALTPQGGEIERHMIFMTDGDPCTGADNYTAYGVNWFDRRQTDPSQVPTGGCTTSGTLTEQVNLRTAALCTAIKNKNITLWVITFGSLASDTVSRMTACATPGRYFSANNAAELQSTFASIANQISQLRVTR